jgi:catechol 2,3-dioxygenase-like lactoylglutathione lyase family enzyme
MASKTHLATLVTIKNMNRAIKFYTEKLGAKVQMRGEGEMKDGWASLSLVGQEIWLVGASKQEKRTLAYNTFIVPNIATFVAGLVRKGVKFERAEKMSKETKVKGPIAYDAYGAAAFFKDTEGNLFMVWQNTFQM